MKSAVNRRIVCLVCGDENTGKHFGVSTCNSCKMFFNHSVKVKQQYHCRFNQNCVVDNRNLCRYCHLKKCFKVGMQREAHMESNENRSYSSDEEDELTSLSTLLKAEKQIQYKKDQEICSDQRQVASIDDIGDFMTGELAALIKWTKSIPAFASLQEQDQITLIQAYACKSLVLGAARRSIGCSDVLLLANNFVIPRDGNINQEIGDVADRIIDELVVPFTKLKLDDTEFVYLKSLILFDFSKLSSKLHINLRELFTAKIKNSNARSMVKKIRRNIIGDFEDYIKSQRNMSGRFGEILLLLPVVESISSLLNKSVKFVERIEVTKTDDFFSEV